MALNPQNLIIPTSEKARRIGAMGGKASGQAKKRKKDLKLAFEILMDKKYKNSKGEQLTGTELLALKQFEKAVKGDTKAFEVVRDTSGQKPVERIVTTTISESDIKEIEDFFNK